MDFCPNVRKKEKNTPKHGSLRSFFRVFFVESGKRGLQVNIRPKFEQLWKENDPGLVVVKVVQLPLSLFGLHRWSQSRLRSKAH